MGPCFRTRCARDCRNPVAECSVAFSKQRRGRVRKHQACNLSVPLLCRMRVSRNIPPFHGGPVHSERCFSAGCDGEHHLRRDRVRLFGSLHRPGTPRITMSWTSCARALRTTGASCSLYWLTSNPTFLWTTGSLCWPRWQEIVARCGAHLFWTKSHRGSKSL